MALVLPTVQLVSIVLVELPRVLIVQQDLLAHLQLLVLKIPAHLELTQLDAKQHVPRVHLENIALQQHLRRL